MSVLEQHPLPICPVLLLEFKMCQKQTHYHKWIFFSIASTNVSLITASITNSIMCYYMLSKYIIIKLMYYECIYLLYSFCQCHYNNSFHHQSVMCHCMLLKCVITCIIKASINSISATNVSRVTRVAASITNLSCVTA